MFHTIQFLKQLWTPEAIDTYSWYDASDTASITDSGGAVSQWNDKSGTGNHLTPLSAGVEPTTNSRTRANLNVIDFDGTEYLRNNSITLPTSGNLSIFMTAGIDVIDNRFDSLWSMDAAANDFQFASNDTTSDSRFLGAITGISTVACSNGPYAGPSVYSNKFDYSGSTMSIWIDGTQDGSGNYYTKLNSTMEWMVFANRAENQRIDGFCAELVLVEDCSTECQQKIEGYLAHKWWTAWRLPSDHPYKNTPPTA